jgi:hypothetical protein
LFGKSSEYFDFADALCCCERDAVDAVSKIKKLIWNEKEKHVLVFANHILFRLGSSEEIFSLQPAKSTGNFFHVEED